jgi:hypothetical protein
MTCESGDLPRVMPAMMLRAKADRAENNRISRVVPSSGSIFLLTFVSRRTRLFELRPGLLNDVDSHSWRR